MRSTWNRPRGQKTVGINVFIAPDAKNILDDIVAKADVPQWAVIEAALRAGTPGPDGIPVEWHLPRRPSEPLPVEEFQQKSA